jgi:hypothetical protein
MRKKKKDWVVLGLIKSAEQSPWAVCSHSTDEDLPHRLLDWKIHYCSQEPATVPRSEPDEPSYNIHFNIILPFSLDLPRCLFPSRFATRIVYALLISFTYNADSGSN